MMLKLVEVRGGVVMTTEGCYHLDQVEEEVAPVVMVTRDLLPLMIVTRLLLVQDCSAMLVCLPTCHSQDESPWELSSSCSHQRSNMFLSHTCLSFHWEPCLEPA